MRGTVQDGSGAVLPNADVTLHNEGENNDRVAKSDGTGAFSIENVKPGQYVIHANLDGFSETVVRGISLEARQDLRLTVTMSIASQTRPDCFREIG